MLLQGKVAIVTGAAQGIGRAIAHAFAEQDAAVVLCDLKLEIASAAAAEIRAQTGGRAEAALLDVTRKPDLDALVADVARRFGRLDVMVNNAGILLHAPVTETTERDWDRVFAVNVKGVLFGIQAAARVMVAQRGGRIINMSSCSGKKPTAHEGAYCASKSAVIGLTRVAALELGPSGITCNAICPGATDTQMVRSTFITSAEVEREWIEKTALKRLGTPQDVAGAAVFLASSLADHVTGEALVVSGGELMTQ